MKETRMPPAPTANLVANSGNALYEVWVIEPLGANFSEVLIKKIDLFHNRKCILKCRMRKGGHFV